jgi:hypothetical protein
LKAFPSNPQQSRCSHSYYEEIGLLTSKFGQEMMQGNRSDGILGSLVEPACSIIQHIFNISFL